MRISHPLHLTLLCVALATAACTDATAAGPLAFMPAEAANTSPMSWTMSRLPNIAEGDAQSNPWSTNDSGQIAGIGCAFELGTRLGCYYAVLWDQGAIQDLGGLSFYEDLAFGINASGQVVGYSGFPSRAVLWDHGVVTDLGALPSCTSSTTAYDINNLGVVVGTCREGGDHELHALVWDHGTITDLGVGIAYAINDRGRVVGTSGGRAVLWKNGGVTDLGEGTAYDINALSQVVGTSLGHATLWEYGTVRDQGPGIAYAINDVGRIVGTSLGRSVLWDRGATVDLGEGYARGINNNFQIVGWDNHLGGVLWTPTW